MKGYSHRSRKMSMKKWKNASREKLILIIKVFLIVKLENTKKRWNALIWACCQGSNAIVKLLLSKGAGNQYLEVKPENRHVPIGSTK